MRFGSRRSVARDPALILLEEEARMFALANERLKRQAEIWWPHELFLTYDQAVTNHGVCPAVIDVTGRARHLAFGPFRPLKPGLWRASLVLLVSAKAARRPLAADFGAEPNFTLYTLPYGVPGLHHIALENTLGPDDLAQVRLWVKRPAFEGEVGFLGVALNSIDAPSSDPASSEGVM